MTDVLDKIIRLLDSLDQESRLTIISEINDKYSRNGLFSPSLDEMDALTIMEFTGHLLGLIRAGQEDQVRIILADNETRFNILVLGLRKSVDCSIDDTIQFLKERAQ